MERAYEVKAGCISIACPCGATSIASPKTRNGINYAFVNRIFRNRGWLVGRRPADDRCPQCIIPKHIKKKEEKPVESATILPITAAEPPRQPTPSDRRKIADVLETSYDPAKGYKGKASDDSIAKQLTVPRAWVSDVRVYMFGEIATNEAHTELVAEVAAIEERVKTLEKAIDQSISLLGTLQVQIEKLKKKL